MTKKKKGLADALLKAHVQFVVERLQGDALQAWLEHELDALLVDAGKLKLEEAVTRQMIKDTARTYAVELEIAGSLPELVGDIARALYAHEIHAQTRLADLASTTHVYELTDIALGLRTLREKIINGVLSSPVYRSFASDLLYRGIVGYLTQNSMTRRIPGADSVMRIGKNMLSKASPGLEASIEDGLRKYIERSIEATSGRSAELLRSSLEDEPLRALVLDIWDRMKTQRVDQLRDDIGSRDIEELFVAGYEFWLDLRRTPFYATMIDTGIDVFFDKYGSATLRELLDELGITRELMLREAMRYATHVVPVLKRRKLLEPAIRRLLADFYASKAVAELLGELG